MTAKSNPLITLTSDFGQRDPYVAAMKGILYGINPDARIVDLSHETGPHDIFEASVFLANTLPFFPPGTIHLAVVDPGVGSERRPIALRAGNQILVCPDNGLPTMLLRDYPLQEAYIISNPHVMRDTISATFHGRDIFAPAAAHLSLGMALDELGEEIDVITTLNAPQPEVAEARIMGEVIHIDRFGNLITNIHQKLLGGRTPLAVQVSNRRLSGGIHRTYSEVAHGTPLALFGSSGYLEIAVNGGSAQVALHLDRGDPVSIEFPARAQRE